MKNAIKNKAEIFREKATIDRIKTSRTILERKKKISESILTQPTKTYSSKTFKLIISLINEQGSEQTKQDILSNISPSKVSIGIDKLTSVKNGSIIVQSESKSSLQKMEDVMKGSMKDWCKREEPKGRKPNVVFTNIDHDMILEDIIEAIVNQNENSTKADEEMMKLMRKTAKGKKFLLCN
ncbi:hypothetical protein WA026_004292 [Henosepilachna vigintioctopunctata]|uniref:Uncharacterized protein n=1 Tax=Henosepilachna vigintioctopunctata TaxID=420089 RepID=A0AAW1V9L9_9CUCU